MWIGLETTELMDGAGWEGALCTAYPGLRGLDENLGHRSLLRAEDLAAYSISYNRQTGAFQKMLLMRHKSQSDVPDDLCCQLL